jgi:hypothetical protein
MKNKKLTVFLIIFSVIIWGYFGYTIFLDFFAEKTTNDNTYTTINLKDLKHKKDTFNILNNYRDPFLNHLNIVRTQLINNKQIVAKPAKIISPPPVIVWPRIKFGGRIKNQKSNKEVVLISINDKSYAAKTGESFSEGVVITNTWKDSIEVMFNKSKKVFK